MRLAPGYNERLQAYDRELRIRWSPIQERWLLERKARYQRLSIDPELYGTREHDTVRQLADGFFTVGSYLPHDLPTVDNLIRYLRPRDTWQRGNQELDQLAEALANELDAEDERRREARRKAAVGHAGDVAGEVWEYHRWKEGQRVVVPQGFPSRGRARRALEPRP